MRRCNGIWATHDEYAHRILSRIDAWHEPLLSARAGSSCLKRPCSKICSLGQPIRETITFSWQIVRYPVWFRIGHALIQTDTDVVSVSGFLYGSFGADCPVRIASIHHVCLFSRTENICFIVIRSILLLSQWWLHWYLPDGCCLITTLLSYNWRELTDCSSTLCYSMLWKEWVLRGSALLRYDVCSITVWCNCRYFSSLLTRHTMFSASSTRVWIHTQRNGLSQTLAQIICLLGNMLSSIRKRRSMPLQLELPWIYQITTAVPQCFNLKFLHHELYNACFSLGQWLISDRRSRNCNFLWTFKPSKHL